MNGPETAPPDDVLTAAAIFAIDPQCVGGIALKTRAGPERDRFVAFITSCLPSGMKLHRMPPHIAEGRLLGGLDLAATLQAGTPISERGLLSQADGGILTIPMAERLSASTAACIGAVLDSGELLVERDGFRLRQATRFGVLAFDEGIEDNEALPAPLLDRLALPVILPPGWAPDLSVYDPENLTAARDRLAAIRPDTRVIEVLCGTALALGVQSLRPSLLAVRVACISAALAGRDAPNGEDAALAARLVLAPRATMLPVSPEAEQATPPPDTRHESDGNDDSAMDTDKPLEDVVLAAAEAAIPADLLARLKMEGPARRQPSAAGRTGVLQKSVRRGRPAGTRIGDPERGAKLNLLETLRAAAPWQKFRQAMAATSVAPAANASRIIVQRSDFRITRLKQKSETTSIFVVDASGSSALHRLAEAKGAIELLLAECYVRRDQVALIAFRGRGAELLLPPTRSLPRAKRCLASLPGGGGTPLATAIDAAALLADATRRQGRSAATILMTDGRANVARDGTGGRARAEAEALDAARSFRAAGLTGILVDTSPSAQPQAGRLAEEMGAAYLPLPRADSAMLARHIRGATAAPHESRSS